MRWHTAGLCFALAFGTAALTSAPAQAGNPASTKNDKREKAKAKKRAQELMGEGYKLARRSDFASALDKFQAAYAAYPSPNILINMGTSLRHLGRHAEAADAYEEYLSEPGVDPRRRRELEKLIKKIDKQVGWLEISVREEESEVRLDGRVVDLLALEGPLRVDPGEHTVSVEADGIPTALRRFTIEVGDHESLTFEQVKPRPPPAPPPEADHGAVQRAVSYAVGGVGAASLFVGAVVGGLALSNDSAASDECVAVGDTLRCDADGVDLADDAQTQATAATVAFVAGTVLVGAGLAIYLTAPEAGPGDDDDSEDGVVTVARVGMVEAGAAGLSMSVSF
jgi:hypothetical protein